MAPLSILQKCAVHSAYCQLQVLSKALHFFEEFIHSRPLNVAYSQNLFSLSQNNIDYCTKKETTLRVGHFTTISGHFSANYINIFHKTGVQRNILRCLTCLNLNWIKSYDIKSFFSHFWGIKSYDIILVKNSFFSCLKMHHFRAILPK